MFDRSITITNLKLVMNERSGSEAEAAVVLFNVGEEYELVVLTSEAKGNSKITFL